MGKFKMIITKTIRDQYGSKFAFVTGARDFVGLEDGLMFTIPRSKNGITKVIVKLNNEDLYDVQYGKLVKYEFVEVDSTENLFNSELRPDFTSKTGIQTVIL